MIRMSVEGTPSGVGRWRLNLKILSSRKAWLTLPNAGQGSQLTWKRQNAYWMPGENPAFPLAVSGLARKTTLGQAKQTKEPCLRVGVLDFKVLAPRFLAPAQPAPMLIQPRLSISVPGLSFAFRQRLAGTIPPSACWIDNQLSAELAG